MELKKLPLTNILVEIFSVVLAVLLALGMNEWRTNKNNEDLSLAAFDKIVKEVKSNKNKLDTLLVNHKEILVEIDSVISKLTRKSNEISFGQIVFEAPSATAWEAAKLTTAVNYMEYDRVEKITSVYSTQKVYNDVSDRVFQELVFFVPDKDREKMKNQFYKQKVYLYNLISIEEQLIDEYVKFLDDVKSQGL
ncbi:MAG: hypothetical protein OQJ93_06450 [Ignavibacteriaceae bacterium]|jgi:hypothetical protein|nr:hypothetical protein [Ignavibacteriaceae bacterium]MCW8812231.1 hypothetical protein [Chlorobium sp.]MCW8818366.1 hypothetical protein [Ignavibacteriaceae bacterium]MCW8960666.1 hypothetical protein [Ignavibacteriaceae bacterium]MCW9097011.1 hypothetical protein [Ignavibacteriaceae bacterium]